MSYFKAKMHRIRFRLGRREKGGEGNGERGEGKERGKGRESGRGDGIDIAWPDL